MRCENHETPSNGNEPHRKMGLFACADGTGVIELRIESKRRIPMNELTLESLAKRVEALEAAVKANQARPDSLTEAVEKKLTQDSSDKFDSDFLNATDRVFKEHEELLRRLA